MTKPSNLAEIASLLSCLCLGATVGCRVTLPNPEHCYYAQGDETCAERFPDLAAGFAELLAQLSAEPLELELGLRARAESSEADR